MQSRLFHKIKAIIILPLVILTAFILFFSSAEYKPFSARPYNADILIENVTIVTLDEESRIIKKGWIAIENGVITGIGEKNSDFSAKEIIDAEGKIAMPGLVNTHTHAAMTLFRGINDEFGLADWLQSMKNYEKKIDEMDVYWGALLGEIEMIKSGTTTFNDMYFYQNSTVESLKKTGMRAIINIPFSLNNNNIKIDQKLVFSNKNHSTIKLSFAPNPLINFSLDNLRAINDLAKKNGFIVHVHIEEDENDKKSSLDRHGLTPFEMLKNSGLLDRKIILVHSINFTSNEINDLSGYQNAGISLNSKSNFKLSGSTAPLDKILDNNLSVGLGTDGAASNNSLDMFDQINFVSFALRKCDSAKNYCSDKKNISPEKIIRMATGDGAKILGLDSEIGSLEIGKKADIILIDFDKTEFTPSYDIYSSLAYNTDGSDVSDSIIDGKIVMRNRKLANVNEKEVINEVNNISKKIKNLAN